MFGTCAYTGGSAPSARRMLIWVGVFDTWSSPRITCVIRSSMSSTGLAKLYVGRPSERTITRSARCAFANSIRPRTTSSHPTTPSSGIRKRIAPASSYAFPSATSRWASSRAVCIRSSWNVTGPSQSIPSQRSDSWICSTDSATSRLVSVFSIRSRHSPPCCRANSQLNRNVRTPPMWRKPVGLGAMRTRTDIGPYRRVAMLLGAHVSAAGGIDTAIDRIEQIGGDCVQVFTQSPRTWRPARDDPIYEKSIATMQATVEVAGAIGADGVVFHVGSHLGAGFDAGLERVSAALERILERCTGETWLLIENSAGAGGTIGRSLEELAALHRALGAHARLGLCIDSCHLYASGYDVTDPAAVDALVREIDATIGLERLRALHVNDSATPLGSNVDRHANLLEGRMGEGLGAFLSHPKLQHLPAYLEVPGADGRGPDAGELRKLRELHARWT